jgi:N-methylhydantoinase A
MATKIMNSEPPSGTRLAVDIGGTFSDLVYVEEATGRVAVAKGPSTPAAPERGVLEVIEAEMPRSLLSEAELFLHGSTVALNALIERKGANVALITTEGFRDVLEIRRGERDVFTDVRWKAPAPLVRRSLRLEVGERILADGSIDRPLDVGDVVDAAALLAAEEIDCVAVVLVNAWVNSAHEEEVERLLRGCGFTGTISLSSGVSGEYREYERTSTTVIDAYIRPRVESYLRALGDGLGAEGFGGDCLMTTSGGGAVSFTEAQQRPFEHIQSGPVAGAVAAAALCRALGIERGVAADVGGTSFDTSLIVDGRPQLQYEGSVIGMPVQAPWVDVRSIGAGGGSLVAVDAAGRLQVGPRSAGADPGPACYGNGGTEPAVTDAALLLGMLGPGRLAGGLVLDAEQARTAMSSVAERVGLDVDALSRGVMEIAASHMANAVRQITLERGEDPREASLVAFGGAGPLLGSLLARELDIRSMVVPVHAGNFSAWGLLVQDVIREASATLVAPLDDDSLRRASAVVQQLASRLEARAGEGLARLGPPSLEASLSLRYRGQEYTLTVRAELDERGRIASAPADLRAAFIERHDRTYGHAQDEPVEVVSVRLRQVSGLSPLTATQTIEEHEGERESIRAFSFAAGAWTEFALVDRSWLSPGSITLGPAIVLEPTATTYIDDGDSTFVEPETHAMVITLRGRR